MNDRFKGVIAMLVLAFVFGVMGVFARELDAGFTIFQQVYLRIGFAFLFAAVLFAPFANWGGYLKISTWEWGLLAFRGVSMYVAASLWTFALLNASYSNVAFITAVPLLPLFGYYIFRDKLTPQIIAYIAVGVVGVVLIGVKDWSDITSIGIGELAALVSVIFFDLTYIGRKWQSGLLNDMATTVAMFFFGSLVIFAASLVSGESLPLISSFTPWLVLMLVVAALFNVFHVVLTNYGFSKLTTTLAGTILTLETVFALGISILVYGEVPTVIEFIGSALILFSVYRINKLT